MGSWMNRLVRCLTATVMVGGVLAIPALMANRVEAQAFDATPVFTVALAADRSPAVAGDELRLAVVLEVEPGWHVNSDEPGDDFSLPTTVDWRMPEGWVRPVLQFPDGKKLEFAFADAPIEVWEGRVVIAGSTTVPPAATLTAEIEVTVTAQACNNTQCLPPLPVSARAVLDIAAAGSSWSPANPGLFAGVTTGAGVGGPDDLGSRSLPLLLVGVFLAGLALNLTPCVFPLIPITVGFFSRQTGTRGGRTFGLAVAYVLGIAVTYSVLGTLAALSGALFGGILQSPWAVAVIVLVLLALAASMFGAWEMSVPLPAWAQSGRAGLAGAFVMGLVMGLVAAPCIGPFVLGLLTYVGQQGDPVLGFGLFFTLALGLGLPYLVLGTFTGMVNRLPASGMWMVGVRRVFGVALVAMAAYFAAPLLPGSSGEWLMTAVLVLGGLYLLVVDRTGHEQPAVDRVVRLATAAMVAAGVAIAPLGAVPSGGAAGGSGAGLSWQAYEPDAVASAVAAGRPVILDFYADWCAPCRELDEKTFADPRVASALAGHERFKVDLTRASQTTAEISRRWDVRGVPTVIVLDGSSESFRITGFEPPDRFLERLR